MNCVACNGEQIEQFSEPQRLKILLTQGRDEADVTNTTYPYIFPLLACASRVQGRSRRVYTSHSLAPSQAVAKRQHRVSTRTNISPISMKDIRVYANRTYFASTTHPDFISLVCFHETFFEVLFYKSYVAKSRRFLPSFAFTRLGIHPP